MDTEQMLSGQDDKKWDRVWTTDEIRKNSANWTLAGDVGLYNLINEFSQNIISRTHEVQNAVDSLVHNTKMASVKINNVINDFHMLSNVQFVENRVYDEEVQESAPEIKPPEKTKEQREAEMLPKIIKAVELGMAVLDQAFNRINVDEISDSDDEDLSSEGRVIFEPKNPYEHRPLPYIIGSDEFMADDYAGLKDLIKEDAESSIEIESSSSESDETSSDEEELPLDDDKFSGIPTPRKEVQSVSDRYSSSEESELFGVGTEENGFISDSSVDAKVKEEKVNQKPTEEAKVETRDNRQSSISSMQSKLNLPQVLPMPKQLQKKKESDDLFANEDSDDESPFRKKTGLFTSDVRFDDEKDMFESDLFGSSKPKEIPKSVESPKAPPVQKPQTTVKKNKEPDLFGDDEDSEDDIFNKLTKAKKPTLPKESLVPKVESPDKADSSSTPSSAPSIKASGNAFDFVTGAGNSNSLFADDSDDDLFSTKKSVTKKFDFAGDDDTDDLFGLTAEEKPKKVEVPEKKKPETEKTALFNPSSSGAKEKSYKKMGMPLPGLVSSKKTKDSIFDDSDSSEQGEKKENVPAPTIPRQAKGISLFDDDDEEDDIFSQKPKLFSPGKSPSVKNKPENSPPAEIPKEEVKKETPVVKKVAQPSLFDDFGQEDKSELILPVKKKPDTSLFEESDNFDLFKPNVVNNRKEPEVITAKVPEKKKPESEKASLFDSSASKETVPETNSKPSLFTSSDQTDGGASSKAKVTSSPAKIKESVDSQIGFDVPIDSSKTLNVINKDRAKIATKRRKPTRKGRLAALEASDSEPISDSFPAPVPKSSTTDSADDLFSSEEPEAPVITTKPASTHKFQEKKKMDLMSQLMSEAASSKVLRKVPAKKEEEEDVVDIFAELDGKRDKSQSFSFKSPIESSSSNSFLEDEKTDDKGGDSFLASDEGDNDEFFAEPSFRSNTKYVEFSNSVSKTESILDMDDDDDLFSIKPSTEAKAKVDSLDNDIFSDDTDIFAEIPKEKYEMFPSQLYEDEDDDDIFGSMDTSSKKVEKPAAQVTNSVPVKKEIEKKTVKEVEKKPAFEDPLTGLLGDD